MLIPYGTDSNAFRPKGVKSYGIFPAILSGETVASMHGDGERVPLDGIGEAAQIFFEALRDTLATLEENRTSEARCPSASLTASPPIRSATLPTIAAPIATSKLDALR